jgi:transposase-like protein
MNILNQLPKSLQGNARQDLRAIWLAPDRATAAAALATFAAKDAPKYARAVACPVKDREALLASFPAEPWDHLRSSDPIESVLATVRPLSQETAKLMVFKLVLAAAGTWRRLKGENRLPKGIEGVTFKDGGEVTTADAKHAA